MWSTKISQIRVSFASLALVLVPLIERTPISLALFGMMQYGDQVLPAYHIQAMLLFLDEWLLAVFFFIVPISPQDNEGLLVSE
jgi:hypothetical protein